MWSGRSPVVACGPALARWLQVFHGGRFYPPPDRLSPEDPRPEGLVLQRLWLITLSLRTLHLPSPWVVPAVLGCGSEWHGRR